MNLWFGALDVVSAVGLATEAFDGAKEGGEYARIVDMDVCC